MRVHPTPATEFVVAEYVETDDDLPTTLYRSLDQDAAQRYVNHPDTRELREGLQELHTNLTRIVAYVEDTDDEVVADALQMIVSTLLPPTVTTLAYIDTNRKG